jgi:hypothetical protein
VLFGAYTVPLIEVVPPPVQLTCCKQSPVQVWAGDSAQSNTTTHSKANKQRIADLPGDSQIRTRSELNSSPDCRSADGAQKINPRLVIKGWDLPSSSCLTLPHRTPRLAFMEVRLTPDQEAFIRQAIASGRFQREEEVISHG